MVTPSSEGDLAHRFSVDPWMTCLPVDDLRRYPFCCLRHIYHVHCGGQDRAELDVERDAGAGLRHGGRAGLMAARPLINGVQAKTADERVRPASNQRQAESRPDDHLDLRVAELCHDLRHPIATISALVAAAELDPSLSPDVARRLAQIESEARRASDLCAHVLGSGSSLHLARLDHLVAEVVDVARLSFQGTLDLVVSPVVICAVDASVRRVVWNLLDNAFRAAGADGRVLVAVFSNHEEARLEVSDSGPGFGRSPSGSSALGLQIVGDMAREHGGRIEIGDSDLGGASVTLVLLLDDRERPHGTGRLEPSAQAGLRRSYCA